MPTKQMLKDESDKLDEKQFLAALLAMRSGDFTVRMPVDKTGVAGKIADVLNEVIELNQRMASEFERINNVVGKEGRITQRATLGGAGGSWAASIESVNALIADLVQPTAEVARVIGAVARGDLAQSMALEIEGRPLRGEFLRTAKVVNTMVDQLGSFASEVTRVAREVGTEGKLGGQARGQGRLRHLEGPDRQRQLHGRQPHRPGAQHRRGDHGRRQRRLVQEDYRRCARARFSN